MEVQHANPAHQGGPHGNQNGGQEGTCARGRRRSAILEKLAPAIEQVDSSSGGIGSAVNRAIETLVPIIAKADAARPVREKWLDRLWDALQEDNMP